jgi:hypothetical protein
MTENRLADRAAIADIMYTYAKAIDSKDFALLQDVFAADLRADFRSFGVKDIYDGPVAGWIGSIRAGIAGMDATQHMLSNHLYEITEAGDRATGTTYLRAIHVCHNDWGDDHYTIGGHYDVDLARGPAGWRITSYKLTVTWNQGNRQVLRAAVRRGAR